MEANPLFHSSSVLYLTFNSSFLQGRDKFSCTCSTSIRTLSDLQTLKPIEVDELKATFTRICDLNKHRNREFLLISQLSILREHCVLLYTKIAPKRSSLFLPNRRIQITNRHSWLHVYYSIRGYKAPSFRTTIKQEAWLQIKI